MCKGICTHKGLALSAMVSASRPTAPAIALAKQSDQRLLLTVLQDYISLLEAGYRCNGVEDAGPMIRRLRYLEAALVLQASDTGGF
jgi:hypothetical protein